MVSSARRLALFVAAFAAVCLAAPVVAGAATTRYAAPAGGTAPCLETSPCSIENALSNAEGLANGDTVLLAPGTYHPAGELNVLRLSITISAEPGKPAPLIEAAPGAERAILLQNIATLRDLRFHSGPTNTYGLVATRPGTIVERVESGGEANVACAFGGVTVRDSLCVSTAAVSSGIYTSLGSPSPLTQQLTLANVTAISPAAGIVAQAGEFATVLVDATNTIASGGTEHDVIARATSATATAQVALSHSNFDDISEQGSGTVSVTPPTASSNQSAPPIFLNPAAGEYAEQAASPTRLAGDLGVVLPGETDLAGNPRTTNCAGTVGVDIGAYQYECPPPEPPLIPVSPVTSTPNPFESNPPAVGPTLSKLALKPAKFAVTGSGKAKKGTTISFTLSIAASVKLEVLGKKTVKGKKKTVTLGALPPVSGKAGPNSVKFAGKLKGKPEPLAPGKYTLRATASAGGFSSSPATAGFEVRIP